jgi:elongation factor P
MKMNANSLRAGNVIEHENRLLMVVKTEVSQPGKGGSVMQVEFRDLRTGNKDNIRFRTQENVERIRLEQTPFQYLYPEDDGFVFMNNETFEQITINKDLIGYPVVFLKDGMEVIVETYEDEPLNVELPDQVTMDIVEAEPVVKGQTASSSYKPAILENGERVMVPPHIESGTRIVVKTEDGTYVERAKD